MDKSEQLVDQYKGEVLQQQYPNLDPGEYDQAKIGPVVTTGDTDLEQLEQMWIWDISMRKKLRVLNNFLQNRISTANMCLYF